MSSIKEAISGLTSSLPEGVRLVAVSKYHPVEAIEEAYSAGQRIFGESHVQELRAKHELLPEDICWHFIGHLQTNKVKYIAPFVSMIESVDSDRLLAEIDKQARRCNRAIDVLLELHMADEETKSGLTTNECTALLESGVGRYPNVRVCGLMTMASNVDDEAQIEDEFRRAADYFDHAKRRFFPADDSFRERSWGMSHDYPLALRQRSTLIRVGTRIFGERVY